MKIWLHLANKEWHEQKWKLLALTAILCSMLFMTVESYSPADGGMLPTFLLAPYIAFATIYVAMGVCSAEYSSRAIFFVRALPVGLSKVAAIRFLGGLLVVTIPMLAFAVLATFALQFRPYLEVAPFPMTAQLSATGIIWLITGIVGFGAALNLLAWIAAIAVNLKSEFRAGLAGLIIAVGLVTMGAIGLAAWDNFLPQVRYFFVALLMLTPMAWLGIFDFIKNGLSSLVLMTIAVQIIVDILLFTIFIKRYGREEPRIESLLARIPTWDGILRQIPWSQPRTASTLDPPLKSPWSALIWLQLRQSVPVSLVALVLLAGIILMVDSANVVDGMNAMAPFVGCLLALVVGNGSYVHELEPKLYAFWRSRPIPPLRWFWLKFFAGLFAIFVVFDLPCVMFGRGQISMQMYSGYGPWFVFLLHFLVYSFAVFCACTFRHPVYSMIFALCFVGGYLCIPNLFPSIPYFAVLWGEAAGDGPPAFGAFLAGILLMLPISVAATFAAATLIKRDIALTV